MPGSIEIERKFLLRTTGWGRPERSVDMRQGYLMGAPGRSLRIRQAGDRFVLTLKVVRDHHSRHEFEYDVPEADGMALLALCDRPPIEKVRHVIRHADHVWEVDLFSGANAGLMLAEVELTSPDEAVVLPAWVGPEVTGDPRFGNAELYRRPFGDWGVRYQDLLKALGAAAQ